MYYTQDEIDNAYHQGITAGRIEGWLYGLLTACGIAAGILFTYL